MRDTKLYVLTCGTMWVEPGFIIHFENYRTQDKSNTSGSFPTVSSQYFIDHPGGKILVDLGYTTKDWLPRVGFPGRPNEEGIRFEQQEDENPEAQLKKIGVTLGEIDYVIISHLMIDHAGYLPLFDGKKTKIILQQKELEHARANSDPKCAPAPFQSWSYKKDHFDRPGLNFFTIEGDYTLVKGVQILFTPGHTPGYQMVRVDLKKEGTIILSPCDLEAMYFGIGINARTPGIPHSCSYSMGDELNNFRKIAALARQENGRIFFGHDQAQFNQLKKIPEYYE